MADKWQNSIFLLLGCFGPNKQHDDHFLKKPGKCRLRQNPLENLLPQFDLDGMVGEECKNFCG